jgi:cell division protein FtsA
VLTGGGALIKHIKELTEFTTGMSVRIGFPTDYISEKSIQDLNSPIYSTSIGLALQALMIEDDAEEVENNTQVDKKKRKTEGKSRKLTGEGVKKIFENLFGDRGEEYK